MKGAATKIEPAVNAAAEHEEKEEEAETESVEEDAEVHVTIEENNNNDQETLDNEEPYPVILTATAIKDEATVYNMTVTNAIKQHGQVATESIMKEIGQIIDKGCLKPVKYENIPFEHRAQILRTIIFVKVKKDGRIKTRLVVDGRGQRHLEYDMSSYAPTARTESVFTTSVVEAKQDLVVATADIEGAFLASKYPFKNRKRNCRYHSQGITKMERICRVEWVHTCFYGEGNLRKHFITSPIQPTPIEIARSNWIQEEVL